VLLACDGFDGVSREYGEVREHAHALVTWGGATPYVWRAAAQKERFERSVRAELSTECWIILNRQVASLPARSSRLQSSLLRDVHVIRADRPSYTMYASRAAIVTFSSFTFSLRKLSSYLNQLGHGVPTE